MASIQHIDDERSAGALADLLNGNTRRRPVVVVTIPAGRTEPYKPDGQRVLVSVHIKQDEKQQRRHIERLRAY